MKFSTKTRYALRFMINLGCNSKSGNIQLNDIAKTENISVKYLSQIVLPLKSSGLITSERGARGGYRLAKQPSCISIRTIVELFEGSLYPTDCITDRSVCKKNTHCITQKVWKRAGDALISTLDNIHLDELVDECIQNRQLFNYSI